jgi:phage head maturation protease
MERFAPGAFKKTVAENRDGMRVLFQHGRDPQIGDKPLGPIESLNADAEYEVPLIDTSYNRDLLPGLKAGLYGASASGSRRERGVAQNPERVGLQPEGLPERTITEARVMEFGPVTFPAYAGASAGVRSLTDEFHGPFAAEARTRPTSLEPEPAVEVTPVPVKDDEPEHSPDASRATPEPDKPQTTSEATEEKTMKEYSSVEEIDARLAEIDERMAEISAEHGVRALPTDAKAVLGRAEGREGAPRG